MGPAPKEKAKANVSDPESRVMKTNKGYVQGYNAQAIVSKDQVIVAMGITQEATDRLQLAPMLATLERTLEEAGVMERPRVVRNAA